MFAPTDNPVMFATLVVLNVPLYVVIGRKVFKSSAAWKSSILDAFRIKHIIPFSGLTRPWPGGKFWLYFVGCFVIVTIEYTLLNALIARYFSGAGEN
jgi:hypothetical protein